MVGEDCTVIVYKCLKSFNDDFLVHAGLHQGSVLSPSLFMIVLKAIIKEIRSGWPEELLYAADVELVGGTLESKDRCKCEEDKNLDYWWKCCKAYWWRQVSLCYL